MQSVNMDRCDPSDPILIPEIIGDDHNVAGPGWLRVYSERAGVRQWLKPLVKCKCGRVTGIGLHHVHADGRVTASFFDSQEKTFVHKGKTYFHEPGCGWHVFIKLKDYDLGEFLPDV